MKPDKESLSFGHYLQAIRLEKKISLEKVSEETRIGLDILKLIDKEDHDNLPAEVFVKGFLRAYARAIGADGEEAVWRYELRLNVVHKLDGSETDPSKKELFLVEGNSAGGTAIEGRFSEFQAILPLRGKVINVEKARLEKAMKNKEILEIIRAIGAGYRENFQIEKVHYHKVILLMDADIDGHHIVCLLLTFFFRYMPELIDEGYLYVSQPPLYRIKKGSKETYVLSDQERDKIVEEWGGNPEISRFKGLGEMGMEEKRMHRH